jgi:hypothetical protein
MTNPFDVLRAMDGKFAASAENHTTSDPLTILTEVREQVLTRVRQLHPAPGCLPVPTLHLPVTADDTVVLDAYQHALGWSLFDDNGNRAPRWIVARERCTHLPSDTVLAINELLVQWHRLLGAAGKSVIDGCRDTPYDLKWSVWGIRRYLAGMPSAPARDLITKATTTAQLRDGQEFSLDNGASWHVCAAGECIGGVAIYTGEHNEHGDPAITRIAAAPRQGCLVRVKPDSRPRPPRFTVNTSSEESETHEVVIDEDGDFDCLDCGASGSTDGYLVNDDGAQDWHDDLPEVHAADDNSGRRAR